MQSFLAAFFPFLIGSTAAYLLPDTPGKYNVTLTTGPLTDYTRVEHTGAGPSRPRTLMVSVFHPAECESTVPVPYMPNKTAEFQGPFLKRTFGIPVDLTPLFLEARLPVCPDACSTIEDDFPVLLFSPSYSIPRLYYNYLASALSSQGFTVILIDHPGNANIIVYPDGSEVYNTNPNISTPTNEDFINTMYPAAADASFIIDQLSNQTAMAELLPHRGPKRFQPDRIAMVGHSLGGAASIIAAGQDSRIRAAVNWDGSIFGHPDLHNMSQPVLFLSHEPKIEPDWLEAYAQMKGSKLIAMVNGTTHETFADVPTMLDASGQGVKGFEDLLGTIAPPEMVKILMTWTSTWMKGAVDDEGGARLLPKENFPEVSILRKHGV